MKLREALRAAAVWAAGLFCLALELWVLFAVLLRGMFALDVRLLITSPTVLQGGPGFLPQILNTVVLTALTLSLALPCAVGCALFLLRPGARWPRRMLERMLLALAGIPSAVYGLFGFLVFSQMLGLRYSLLSGGFTMALLVLPATVKTAQQALCAAEESYSDAAAALGATEAEMTMAVLLPAAGKGLTAAALMAASRVAGESAALLLTAGASNALPRGGLLTHLLSSGATLAVGLYQSVLEGQNDRAFAAAVLLLLLISLLDAAAGRLSGGRK